MDFGTAAPRDQIDATIEAFTARGVAAEYAATRKEALERIRSLVPPGASVSTGASITLKEIGFEELLVSGSHPWKNLKAEFLAEKDPVKQGLLRKQSTLADWYLGSVHGVSRTGELVWASLTGSQLAPYAYSARNVIWVAGAQKLVPSLDLAIRRVREYVYPHEDVRMKESTGGTMGSGIGKILIFEREPPFLGRKLILIIVGETLGD